MDCPVRCSLRANAVFIFTLARRFVGPIRKTPNHSSVKPGSRIGLHRDGNGAHVELAFPWPDYFRNYDFEYSDGDGLYRRRYAEGEASWSVRPDRRGFRRRVHVRTCDWRIGQRCESASRVLDCSRSYPGKLALGLLFRSRIAFARTAETLSTTPRKSSRLADTTAFASRTLAAHHDPVSCIRFPQRL